MVPTYSHLHDGARRNLKGGNFKKAYYFAQQMMRKRRHTVTGYTLCALAAEGMKQYDKAKRIKLNWESIKHELCNCPRPCDPKAAGLPLSALRDPMNLPTEIQLEIFQHLPLHEIVRATRVSRAWQTQITSSRLSSLFRDLQLLQPSPKTTAKSRYIVFCVKNSGGKLRSTILNLNATQAERWAFKFLVKESPELHSLTLLGDAIQFSDIQMHPPLLGQLHALRLCEKVCVHFADYELILEKGVNLVELDIRDLRAVRREHMIRRWTTSSAKLQRLRLRIDMNTGIAQFGEVATEGTAQALQHLQLDGNWMHLTVDKSHPHYPIWGSFDAFQNLKSLTLVGTKLSGALFMPSSLKALHLIDHTFRGGVTGIPELVLPLAGLEELTLAPNGEFLYFPPPIVAPPTLKKLHIKYQGGYNDALLADYIVANQYFSALEDLTIDMSVFGGESARKLETLTGLKRVCMVNSLRLTGWAVKRWVDSFPLLQELVIDNCPEVGFEVIEYARKHVRRVYHKGFKQVKDSGIKVRGLYY